MAEISEAPSYNKLTPEQAAHDHGFEIESPEAKLMLDLSTVIHPDLSTLPPGQNWEQELESLTQVALNAPRSLENFGNIVKSHDLNMAETRAILETDVNTAYSARNHYHETKAQLRLMGASILSLVNGQNDKVENFMSQGTRTVEFRKAFGVIQKALAIHEATQGDSLRTTNELLFEATLPFLEKVKAFAFPKQYLDKGHATLSAVSTRDIRKAIGGASLIVADIASACAGSGEFPTPSPTVTEMAPAEAVKPFTVEQVEQALEEWKSFSTPKDDVTIEGAIEPLKDETDPTGETMLFFHPKNTDGSINTDIQITFANATIRTADGESYPIGFIITRDAGTGKTESTLIQFKGISDGGDGLAVEFEVGEKGPDELVRLATYAFVYEEGTGFFMTKSGFETPWAVGNDGPDVPNFDEIYKSMFKTVALEPSPIPLTPTPEAPVELPTSCFGLIEEVKTDFQSVDPQGRTIEEAFADISKEKGFINGFTPLEPNAWAEGDPRKIVFDGLVLGSRDVVTPTGVGVCIFLRDLNGDVWPILLGVESSSGSYSPAARLLYTNEEVDNSPAEKIDFERLDQIRAWAQSQIGNRATASVIWHWDTSTNIGKGWNGFIALKNDPTDLFAEDSYFRTATKDAEDGGLDSGSIFDYVSEEDSALLAQTVSVH